MNLHTAKRHLLVSLEIEKRLGRPTGDLETALAQNGAERRAFLAYLEKSASSSAV